MFTSKYEIIARSRNNTCHSPHYHKQNKNFATWNGESE